MVHALAAGQPPAPAPLLPRRCAVKSAEQGGKLAAGEARWKALLEVFGLIFVAEWGDRSMLATIALGAAQSPLGESVRAWRLGKGRAASRASCRNASCRKSPSK